MKDNRTSVKRSLFVSAIALTLTAALLIGTTFAWFTSTASTGVSKVEAGKLKVTLLNGDKELSSTDVLTWQKAEDQTDTALWEPGCTYNLEPITIKNTGSLALKYKIVITGIKGDADLNKVIDWTVNDTALDADHPLAVGASNVLTISGHMQENADDNYQGKTIDGISITVVATQDTVEYDSNDNQYDKNATYPVVYPKGITAETFNEHTTDATYYDGAGIKKTGAAVAVYIDSNGQPQYVADIAAAVKEGATEIYCNENAKGRLCAFSDSLGQSNRTPELTKDLTIHANGADFNNGEITLNSDAAALRTNSTNLTLKIYDAKNLKIWGNSPADGVTQTIILENCHNVGTSPLGDIGELIMLNGGNGTVNASVTNCSAENTNQAIKFDCDGSLAVKNCTFTNCAVAIKVSYKGTGTRTDTIEDSVFTKCGCTTYMFNTTDKTDPSYSSDPAKDWRFEYSSAYAYKGNSTNNVSVSLTTKGNKITETIGSTEKKIGSLVTLTEN